MFRPLHAALCCLTLLSVIAPAAGPGGLDHFRCLASGHWDNQVQAAQDVAAGRDDANRHPRRAMTYVPVRNPNIEGQLFAILNYTEPGFDGPLQRVSLHRFRWSDKDNGIVHEFFFLADAERRGNLAEDLGPLTRIRESDVRINENCAMYWRWQGDHYAGATRTGQCITASFTEAPILVEGHGELWPGKLVRHDRNFTLDGEPLPVPGGASPEVFDKVARDDIRPARLRTQIADVAANLDCAR